MLSCSSLEITNMMPIGEVKSILLFCYKVKKLELWNGNSTEILPQ